MAVSKKIIRLPSVPASDRPLAPAVLAGNHFYCATVSTDDQGNIVGVGDIRAQMRQCLDNVARLIEAAGGTMDDVARIMVFLTDMQNFAGMNAVWSEYFAERTFPVRATVNSGLGHPDFLVELDVIGYIDTP